MLSITPFLHEGGWLDSLWR